MTRRTRRTYCLVAWAVAALLTGCGDKRAAGNGSAGRGGATGGGGASAGAAGGMAGHGGTSAGSAGGGGTTGSGGASAGAAGGMAGHGGASAGGGGAGGGTAGSGGGTTGSGGANAGNGGANAGGSGACAACNDLETCWSDLAGDRCVAREVPLPSGFGIDATEVTRRQYAAWLATNPALIGQQPSCTLNRTFVPDATCMALPSVCQGNSCGTHPQPCIDMCDAGAYCQAIDRRLCADADWTTACSANGTYTRPPGNNVVGVGLCNDYTAGATTTVPVASKTGCQLPADSGFGGVFDMIGNLEEWADNCLNNSDSGFADICKPRGLPFGQGAAAPICSQSTYAERGSFRDTLGFRCCTR